MINYIYKQINNYTILNIYFMNILKFINTEEKKIHLRICMAIHS